MPEEIKTEIKTVKSPVPEGVEKLPTSSSIGFVTVSIMLPSGIVITNPEQFENDEANDIEECEDSTAE